MDAVYWQEFLLDWFRDILTLADPDELDGIPPELVDSGWLGHPGASEAQIAAAEQRLGVSLPPSYRAFLAVINGCWLLTGHDGLYHFWPTEEVEWFAVRYQDWIDAWMEIEAMYGAPPAVSGEQYLVYGPNQGVMPPTDYLQTALAVSDQGDNDSIYLLNPRIVTPEGEWEAWSFDHEEIIRYRSFWDLLQAQHKTMLRVLILSSRQRG